MEDFIKNLSSNAKSKKKDNKKAVDKLKKKFTNQEIDNIFHEQHDKAFEQIDCLSCANCCKTTGPLFTNKDIERISAKLNLSQQQFIEKYLKIDEDNDYVLQQAPCSFLGEDNYCGIYEYRPKACREYPHTDRKKQFPLLQLNLKNTEVCPAVYQMFEEIKFKLKGF